ncbi:hypothetical protein G6F40_015639 [Rhizopus arrhizus]|nr:hypothetical protein G6F40_015639 [Rhizopus arrhizus]
MNSSATTATFSRTGPKGCSRNSGKATAMTAVYASTSASCAAHRRRPGPQRVAMPSTKSSAAARYTAARAAAPGRPTGSSNARLPATG